MKSTAPAVAHLNIGQAAQRARVSAKMVRHYESLGLLPVVHRTEAGYRQYTEQQVHTLRFIKRARDLGFSMAEIAELLELWQDKRRPSSRVKQIAAVHVADLDQRIGESEDGRKGERSEFHGPEDSLSEKSCTSR